MKVNVWFSDATQDAIIGSFAGPQDPAAYPNIGAIETSDARWKAFYDQVAPSLPAGALPAPLP